MKLRTLWVISLLILLTLALGPLDGLALPDSPSHADPNSPVQVNLTWDGQPGLNTTLTLTAEVTSRVDADHLTLRWVAPAGVTLSGADTEDLDHISAGQTVSRQRAVTFDQTGAFKVTMGAQMDTLRPAATWGDSDSLYFAIQAGQGSRVSERGPRLASTTEEIEVQVTYTPAAHPDGGYDVYGRFMYEDIPVTAAGPGTPVMVPARHVRVEIWEDDPVFDDHDGTTWTDDDGYFSFHVSNNDDGWLGGNKETYLKVVARSPGAYVTDRTGIDERYVVKTSTHSGGSDIDFGTFWPNSMSPMFNIVDVLLDANRYAEQFRNAPGAVKVQYEPGYGEGTSQWDWFWEEISLADDDDDAYDDTVMLHEYGHYIAYTYACNESPGGPHDIDKFYSKELAFAEGWASYLSSAVRGNSNYWDWLWDSSQWGVAVDWETWDLGVYSGPRNEGTVTATLWDLQDPANETHDRYENGASNIWHTFDDRMQGSSWCTIEEFYEDWVNFGYSSDSDFAAIFKEAQIMVGSETQAQLPEPAALELAEAASPSGPQGQPPEPTGAGLDEIFPGDVPWDGVLFLVDATQSMDNEISAIKQIIQDRVTSLEAEPEAVQMVVETFHDDGDNVQIVDDFFPDIINPAVAGITVSGGGEPEEDTLHAMLKAARRHHGFNIWLFTDAAAKPLQWGLAAGEGEPEDVSLAPEDIGWARILVGRMKRREITPYILVFGDCTDTNTGAEAALSPEGLEDCVEPYLQTAEGLNGQFMFIDTSEVADATEIVRALMSNNAMAGRFNYTVSSSQWTYIWDNVEYDWYDATGGTFHQVTDRKAIPLPTSFAFYNNAYSTAYVARPGYVSFSDFAAVSENTGIPTPALPNRAIYAFWDDIDNVINRDAEGSTAASPSGIYTEHDAVNNQFVIEYWDNYHPMNPSIRESFEILLDLDTDEIIVQYAEGGDDASTTLGVENATGTMATQVAYDNEGFLYPGRAIKYTPLPPGPRDHEVLVDSTMDSASFFLNGYYGTVNLTLYRPNGSPVSPSDPDVTFLTVSQAVYYRIDSPAAGTWIARVSGDGSYYFTSSSVSPLQAEYEGETELNMGSSTLLVNLGMSLPVQPTFGLVDRRGMLVDTLMLYDDGAHDDGEANDGIYGGPYTPAMPGSFYLQVEGQTPAGEPFRRLDLVPITFQRMVMYVSGSDTRFAQPGGAVLYTFVIENQSPLTRTFNFELESTMDWAAGLPYPSATLAPYTWDVVPVTVWVPAGANGLVDQTTLAAVAGEMSGTTTAVTIARGPADLVTLEAHPAEINNNGSQSTIVVYAEDDHGFAVADSTTVGLQASAGSISPVSTTTYNGVATATLTSGAATGTVYVQAIADGVTGMISLEVTAPEADSIALSAADSWLPPDGTSTTTVTAYIYDEYGNPAPNGTQVVIGVEGDDMQWGTIEDAEVYTGTTNGGQLAVTYRSGTTHGTAVVRAEVVGSSLPPGAGEGVDASRSASITIPLRTGSYLVYLPLAVK
jgi:hypothetical protein